MEDKHSGPGIASFCLSIIVAVLTFALVCYAGYLEMSTPGGVDEKDPKVMLIGVVFLGLMFLDLIAGVLGLAGLFQPDRKKLFPILGLLGSVATVGGVVALVIIGNMAQ